MLDSGSETTGSHEQSALDSTLAIGKQNTPENAEMLATKWLSTRQLADLAQNEGLVYKQGKFSAEEDSLMREAITSYQEVARVRPPSTSCHID